MIERLQNQILIKISENDKNKKLLQTKSDKIRSLQNEIETLRNNTQKEIEANKNRLNEATQVLTKLYISMFDSHIFANTKKGKFTTKKNFFRITK